MVITPHRLDQLKLFASMLLLVLSLSQVFWSAIRVDGFYDLPAFTGAAGALFSGHSPYEHEYANRLTTVNFQYPPAAALWLAPLLLIPTTITSSLFTVLSLSAFLGALWLSFLLLPGKQPTTWKRLMIMALLLQTFPLKMTIMLGQVNAFVLLLMMSSLFLLKREKLLPSAVLMSGAISLKIIPVVFVILAFLRREFHWALLVSAFAIGLNLLFLRDSVTFVIQILPVFLTGLPASGDIFNQSLPALFYRTHLGEISGSLMIVVATTLVILLIRKVGKNTIWLQMIATLPILVLVAANGWQHHLILMYPFIIIFLNKWRWFLPMWLLLAVRPSYILLISPTNSWLWSYQTIGILLMVVWFLAAADKKPTLGIDPLRK